ncbi:MAG: antirestriction protein ArdA [Faecousia sp.]
MAALLEAYITNLGKYNEGQLVGETLKFPTTQEEVQALLKRIGVDGIRYEEIFITSFDGDVLGLHEHLGEYENLDELNYLAVLLSEMDQGDIEKFEAVIDAGEYTGSVKDLINLTKNLDCFEFYSNVHSDEELGRMYVLEFGGVEVPEHLIDYIDYEAYGRDVRINDSGHYAPGGYVTDNRSRFIEHYTGRDDIPDEYRVFSMPKLSIREQMCAFKEIIDRSSTETRRSHANVERDDR